MERLFKITNVYRTEIDARNEGEARRPKVELTLVYHETSFSSQTGVQIRHQSIVVALLDDAARQCQLQPGTWIVANVSHTAYQSRTEPGRIIATTFINNIIPVNINEL